MNAISFTAANGIQLQEVAAPTKAAPEHIIVKMAACGINPGDKAFLSGTFPRGFFPVSQHDICGVSGVGTVLAIGDGVPEEYMNKNVMAYRSLQFSDDVVGTWSQYAQLHYLQCAILPSGVNLEDYSGSLVNLITPYAFLKQAAADGHKGIICTAGNSATGIALLGFCIAYNIPVISIVRDEQGKDELDALGAQNIVVQTDDDFESRLKELALQFNATAVFDGVGGDLLSNIVDVVPGNTTIYAYGFLGGPKPLTMHTSALMRGIALRGFSNFGTPTVQNPQLLRQALKDISAVANMPHFKTKIGKKFGFGEINEALAYTDENGGKAVLYPFQ